MGGPGREIAKFSGANVVGLNCSDYQLERAREHTRKAGLQDLCTYVKVSETIEFCRISATGKQGSVIGMLKFAPMITAKEKNYIR